MKTATKYPDQVSKRERGSGARVCQRSSEACHKVERQENENQNKNLDVSSIFRHLHQYLFPRFEPGKCKEEETTETASFR